MKKSKNGFTVVETLIYSALLSGLLATSLYTSSALIENNSGIETIIDIEENASFIIEKLEWELSGLKDNLTKPYSNFDLFSENNGLIVKGVDGSVPAETDADVDISYRYNGINYDLNSNEVSVTKYHISDIIKNGQYVGDDISVSITDALGDEENKHNYNLRIYKKY